MVELSQALGGVSGIKQYGYLPKKVKALVDSITDALASQPDVAACYQVWNDLRDELERFYKDKPRIHSPLSQQKEFKAIKNSIIREAERLRQELEQNRSMPTDATEHARENSAAPLFPSSPSDSSGQSAPPSAACRHWDPAVMTAVTRLLHHMGQIFRERAIPPANPMGIRVDSKRRRQLMAKRLALGHRAEDHEEWGAPEMK